MDQREEFVLKAMERSVPFRELCRQFAISPKTGYKWMSRFQQGGLPALHDQSTRPHSSPAGLPEDVVCRMVELKFAHPNWGPRKIQALFARKYPGENVPSESSFKRILEKSGLVNKRVRKRRSAADGGRLQLRRQAKEPNEVWTVDFKGWWYTADARRCEPLTIRDAYSRFILCADPLENARTTSVRARFESVFETYGLPETIRSDNGAPFAAPSSLLGLSTLSVWWLALGISLDRIDPGRPDQNGSHERMHRDISLEVQAMAKGDLEMQRAALSLWREEYNSIRPHEALGYMTPAQRYKPSKRDYEGTPDRLVYPQDYAERMVMKCGMVRLNSTRIFLTTALRGWNVGLREEKDKNVGVWFGSLRLGHINLRTDAFHASNPAVEMPP
ncbi:MAG: transposase [Candidatus Sumerlaeia bacterium]|nr:transposase [Candidatus Sumerlaeia bacterium]